MKSVLLLIFFFFFETVNEKTHYFLLFYSEFDLMVNGRDIVDFQYLLSDVKYNVTCRISERLQRQQIISLSSHHLTENHGEELLYKPVIGFNVVKITVEFKSTTLRSSFTCAKLDENGNAYSPSASALDIFGK